jgi:hypothetical protein
MIKYGLKPLSHVCRKELDEFTDRTLESSGVGRMRLLHHSPHPSESPDVRRDSRSLQMTFLQVD